MFTEQDLLQLQRRGSDPATVEQQIRNFEQGFPFLPLVRPATAGDGLRRLSDGETQAYAQAYRERLGSLEVLKFVPASGAASRMFQALFACLNSFDGSEAAKAAVLADKHLSAFFSRIRDFAFFEDLQAACAPDPLDALLEAQEYGIILRKLLTEDGLGYGSLPKGLLQFHRYPEGPRTPAAEHLVEGAAYAAPAGGTAQLHLTVSPEHREKFAAHLGAILPAYEAQLGVRFEVSYSEQKPSTDTIAVDGDNQPFRNEDGSLLFRPAGHGALLDNLDDLSADVIFIKNIDNVVPDRLKAETIRFKQALAGLLLETQTQIFGLLDRLDQDADALAEAEALLEGPLCVTPPDGYAGWSAPERLAYVQAKLSRPLRVCGMVKNEGEPGGGPFWARNSDGTLSLQIAESAQVDKHDPEQQAIAQAATHFNPVDLVCATRDRHGKPFPLMQFRDPQTGFISSKSKDGRELKAQELPGLWNGSMSDWNTVFVEVPVITFNPVKTVNDLLRPEHQ
ncbi:MAG: DUF4301 family protein [Bacteroidia bacterium]|nr:DUF4301 family protein [Bacteroidia bacterium]